MIMIWSIIQFPRLSARLSGFKTRRDGVANPKGQAGNQYLGV